MQTAYRAFSFISSKANIPPVREALGDSAKDKLPRPWPPAVTGVGGGRKEGGYRGAAAALFHCSRQRGLLKSDRNWLGCALKIKYGSRFSERAACFIPRSIILNLLFSGGGGGGGEVQVRVRARSSTKPNLHAPSGSIQLFCAAWCLLGNEEGSLFVFGRKTRRNKKKKQLVLAVHSLFRRTDHHQQFFTGPARLIFIRGAHLQSRTRILMRLQNAQVSSSAPRHPKSQKGMICMPGGGGTCGGEPGSSLTPTLLEAQRGPEFKGHGVLHQTPPDLTCAD